MEVEITQEDFESYIEVQMSGDTNMFNTGMVGDLSGLPEDKIKAIMKQYNELTDKYGGELQ